MPVHDALVGKWASIDRLLLHAHIEGTAHTLFTVLVNGKKGKTCYRVQANDSLRVSAFCFVSSLLVWDNPSKQAHIFIIDAGNHLSRT